MRACGEREAMVMAPPTMRDSAVSPCFHRCLISSAVNSSPHPGIAPEIPKLQLPVTEPSRGPASLSEVCMAAAMTVWLSYYLGCHRSTVSLSALIVFPLTQTTAPMWRLDPASVPHPSNTPVFHPTSFILLSFVWFYIFFSAGQVFLSTLSWCSNALHCLKVSSWCVYGERCTPRPPTPLPSCSLPGL